MKKGIGIVLSVSIVVACSHADPESTGVSRAKLEDEDAGVDGSADGSADAGETCAHSTCTAGVGLSASCSSCATTVCTVDSYCCDVSWDETCVGEGKSLCSTSCDVPEPDSGPSACAHPVCQAGGALAASCDPCATAVCGADPYCCAGSWDATCVGEATSLCGAQCQ